MKKILFVFLIGCAYLTSAQAGTFNIDPLPQAVAPIFPNSTKVPAGTLVLLETAEKFSTDQATVGKQLQFKVRTNVVVDKKVVIATGALAIGRIKSLSESTYNNPAEVTIELQYVQAVDGQMLALDGDEQTIKGMYTGEGTTVEPGKVIVARIMNNTKVKA